MRPSMIMRWFGAQADPVPLSHLAQVPRMSGVAGCLDDIPAGQPWPRERVQHLRAEVERHGLVLEVIESVPIHDDIKAVGPQRDQAIEAFQQTVQVLGEAGVKVICYNFMPVFDWVRTDLAAVLEDGSRAMALDWSTFENEDFGSLITRMLRGSQGHSLPGWEPQRLARIEALIAQYACTDEADLFANLGYFLDAVIPVCRHYDVRLALHPDDPPWSFWGLPRIVKNREDMRRIADRVDDVYNSFTLCVGSLAEAQTNDVPAIIREFTSEGRVPFAHIRNILRTGPHSFQEVAHASEYGSIDMCEVIDAFVASGFDGYIRPDHGRMIWGEQGRPGYGLYDRALGVAYINGLWERSARHEVNKKERNG